MGGPSLGDALKNTQGVSEVYGLRLDIFGWSEKVFTYFIQMQFCRCEDHEVGWEYSLDMPLLLGRERNWLKKISTVY